MSSAAAVFLDIDLTSDSERVALRNALAKLRRHPPLIFAVDRGARFHLQSTQANALGAHRVVKRPLDRRDLLVALEGVSVPIPPPPADLVTKAGGRSVIAAERLIGASFAALSTGAPVKLDQAIAASQDLFAGVGQAGLHAWLDMVREHHAGTFQHCLLVTGAVVAYAAYADLTPAERNTLGVAALLHDIGKAEIPNAILDKPGKLTPEEFAVIQRHPKIGADYLMRQENLPPEIIDPVLHHHEYLDGTGYPDRLRGDEIGKLTRILTACDIYGAMMEQRSYKPARSQSEALYLLLDMAKNGKLDMDVVRTLAAALGAKLAVAPAVVGPAAA